MCPGIAPVNLVSRRPLLFPGGNTAAAAAGGKAPGSKATALHEPPPDDDDEEEEEDYEPDPLLASKARPYTDVVQSKPKGELFHDHMARFKSASEAAPVLIRRYQVVCCTDDADFTVQTRIRGVKTNYVVTYTRRSRKPVFNKIIA